MNYGSSYIHKYPVIKDRLYSCETWPMSVKDEKRMATTEMRMVRWAMGVSLLEHRRNEEILEEAKVEPIAMVLRRRRLE